jgi:hypothetical protein
MILEKKLAQFEPVLFGGLGAVLLKEICERIFYSLTVWTVF